MRPLAALMPVVTTRTHFFAHALAVFRWHLCAAIPALHALLAKTFAVGTTLIVRHLLPVFAHLPAQFTALILGHRFVLRHGCAGLPQEGKYKQENR